MAEDTKIFSRIPKFSGRDKDNWPLWKRSFLAILDTTKLRKNLGTACPAVDGEDKEKWIDANTSIYYQLVLFTTGAAADLVGQFQDEAHGEKAWDALIAKYEAKGVSGQAILFKELNDLVLGESEDPDTFFVKQEILRAQLKALGHEIKDESLLPMTLNKFPPNYYPLVVNLEGQVALTYDGMKTQTISFYKRFIDGKKGGKGGDSALITNRIKEKGGQGGGGSYHRDKNKPHFTPVCHRCGKKGHIRPDCTLKPPIPQGRKHSLKGAFRGKCYDCGEGGHKSVDCPNSKPSSNRANHNGGHDGEIQHHEALIAHAHSRGSEPTPTLCKWVVDSGATCHMVRSKDHMYSFVPEDGTITVADDRVVASIGKGTIIANIKGLDGKAVRVAFKDVLVVPSLARDLLSTDMVNKRGGSIHLTPKGKTIVAPNGLVIPMVRDGGHNVIAYAPTLRVGSPPFLPPVAMAVRVPNPSLTWHRRLGHRNIADTRTLGALNVGVPNNLKAITDCEACAMGKHTLSSFTTTSRHGRDDSITSPTPTGWTRVDSSHRQKHPLARIHIDLFSSGNSSHGGYKYAIVFTDDYSRWRSIFFLKKKSNSLDCLKQFILRMQALLKGKGSKLRQLYFTHHSDNGGEFIGEEYKQYCLDNGILQTFTGAKSPQQNGLAERSNRSIIEMARTMRIAANMPVAYWAEACSTAVYLLNRMPSSVLGGETPYYRLFRKHCSMKHLRVFGCRAFAHIYDDDRKKFDSKARRCIMLGYDEHNTKLYRLYDMDRKKVINTVHATFHEHTFPYKSATPTLIDDQPTAIPAIPTPINEGDDNDSITTTEDVVEVDVGIDDNNGGNTAVVPHDEGDNASGGEGTNNDDTTTVESEYKVENERPSTRAFGWCRDDSCPQYPTWHKAHLTSYTATTKSTIKSKGSKLNKRKVTYADITRGSRKSIDKDWEGDWGKPSDSDSDSEGGNSHSANYASHNIQHAAFAAAADVVGEPRSYKEAMRSPQKSEWLEGIKSEINSHKLNGTWRVVTRPKGVNVVGTRWVFKLKYNELGDISRYKGRIVAQGYSQQYGVDFFDTFAPVAKITSLRLLIALAAIFDWELENMDVDTAYLNADVEEVIYIELPEGCEEYDKNGEKLVGRLVKSIYGLKQAGRNWYHTLIAWLKEYGLKPSGADPCIFIKTYSDGSILIVAIWVDDLFILGSNKAVVSLFKSAISKKFKMKDIGPLTWFLGMQVKRDRANKTITLSQETYTKQLLQKYGMLDCRPISTPDVGELPVIDRKDVEPNKLYMSMVGALNYLAVITRPDIAYSVNRLTRDMQTGQEAHIDAAKLIMRYLQGTLTQCLTYCGQHPQGNTLIGYSDADWGGDRLTRKSTTGYLFMFDSGVISWASKLQPTVATSSSEAEYMAAASATSEAIHLRQLLEDLGFKQEGPTTIFEDNKGCIALSENPTFHKRTKHIAIKFHFIRDRIASGEIVLGYIPTEHQLADGLTKQLPGPKLREHRDLIMGSI